MTDPKTAARAVATRLAESEISVKHVQALDLVAAGCGFQDRSKLSDLAELPVLKRVNARLLSSAATLLARHDAARRTTIVEVVTGVLVPKPTAFDMRDVRSSGERISKGEGHSKGAIPFLKIQADALAAFSQGLHYRPGMALQAPTWDASEVLYASERDGIGARIGGGPFVAAMNQDAVGAVWTLFWNDSDGWGDLASASVHADDSDPLPDAGMAPDAAVRWMHVREARFRAAVDAALLAIDDDEPGVDFDADAPGERTIDYDRVAAAVTLAGVLGRPVGPLEIALRDGAQRAALFEASLSDDPETAGGQVREWLREVESLMTVSGPDREPAEDDMRNLLMDGDAAISGIRNWLPAHDRLWGWLNVAGYPDAVEFAADPEGSGVAEGDIVVAAVAAVAAALPRFAAARRSAFQTVPDEPPSIAAAGLDEARREAADAFFQAHDFRDDVVGDEDGWSWTTPGDEWTRRVYLEADEADVDDETVALTYVVCFAPGTAKVVSSYAISENGSLVGAAIDPELVGTLDLGNDLHVPICAIVGEKALSDLPNAEEIADRVVGDTAFERWQTTDGLHQSIATAFASDAIDSLRRMAPGDDREALLEAVAARHLLPSVVEEDAWSDVRDGCDAFISDVEAAIEDLDERPEFDRGELESELMDMAFARLAARDKSTWRDCIGRMDKVEIYLHLVRDGDWVEDTCTIGSPHALKENVVVDDQFRFVLSRIGIALNDWKAFARPKDVEPARKRAPARRGDPLVTPEQLDVMIQNGGTRNFLVSLYCQAPLRDVLALDLTRPIAFERVSLAVVDVMSGTFHDHRLDGVVEMQDGVDGLLTTSDCGPYASQTEDLVSSAFMSRIGAPEEIAKGPAATAELEILLAVEGLRRNGDARIDWRRTGGNAEGGVVLEAEIPVIDPSRSFGMRRVSAEFADGGSERPDVTIRRP